MAENPLARTAYLVNSTPKYYAMLPLHFALLQRYGGLSQVMDLVLATEAPEHPICQRVAKEYGVRLLPLRAEDSGFLDSRAAALTALEAEGKYEFVLPVQEDFLVDRLPPLLRMDGPGHAPFEYLAKRHAVASVRLMPSPGPKKQQSEMLAWWDLEEGHDTYGFTFQATLWRLDACASWYRYICAELEKAHPRATTDPKRRIAVEVSVNFAENADGQRFFWKWSREGGWRHKAWVRGGPWSNAVYLCPWPYRPTAIVRGRLEPWARELAEREGFGADVRGFA